MLLIGRVVENDGMFHLDVSERVFGHEGPRGLRLPSEVRAGQRIAVFARHASNRHMVVVDGVNGIVQLDVQQAWEGEMLEGPQVDQRLRQAALLRSLDHARDDLERFLRSPHDERMPRQGAQLAFDAGVTARYLGRFPVDDVKPVLMKTLMDASKQPGVRHASADGLFAADPMGSCRLLLRRMLAADPRVMRAETEDGDVTLGCLGLIHTHGTAAFAEDLERLASHVRCPVLSQAAAEAAQGVRIEDKRARNVRKPTVRKAVRLRDGALLTPAAEHEDRGLFVVFRRKAALADFRAVTAILSGAGYGVLVLPAREERPRRWLAQALQSGLVRTEALHFLGVEDSATLALEAARIQAPARVVLLAPKGVYAPAIDGIEIDVIEAAPLWQQDLGAIEALAPAR